MASSDNPFTSLRERRPDSDKFKASPGHILGRKDSSKSRDSSERPSDAPQQSCKEYTVSVQRWLAEYWHHVAYWNTVHNTMAMPMWCVGHQTHGPAGAGQQGGQPEGTAARVPTVTAPRPVVMVNMAQDLRQQQLHAGKEYSVPAVSRRLMAEFLDFLILFFMKLMVTLTMMHFYEGLDPTKFDIRVVLEEMDDDASLEDLQNMLVSAIIYRLCVTVFEAVFLRGSEGQGGIGGATPGKWMMGLQVVSCDYVLPATNGNVRVVPAGHMGWGRSIVRALIKNLSIALFFPICFTVFIFQYNRTAYDVIAGSMVVAKPIRARRNE